MSLQQCCSNSGSAAGLNQRVSEESRVKRCSLFSVSQLTNIGHRQCQHTRSVCGAEGGGVIVRACLYSVCPDYRWKVFDRRRAFHRPRPPPPGLLSRRSHNSQPDLRLLLASSSRTEVHLHVVCMSVRTAGVIHTLGHTKGKQISPTITSYMRHESRFMSCL